MEIGHGPSLVGAWDRQAVLRKWFAAITCLKISLQPSAAKMTIFIEPCLKPLTRNESCVVLAIFEYL